MMSYFNESREFARGQNRWFATTQWSVVLAAGGPSSGASRDALEKLCEIYWFPLYAFVRRSGFAAHDAEELTQEFFTQLIDKQYLDEVRAATEELKSFLDGAPVSFQGILGDQIPFSTFVIVLGFGVLVIWVCIPSLICALLFRGGILLHALGIALVRKDGTRASRLRVFGRSLVAWSPCLAFPIAFALLAALFRAWYPDFSLTIAALLVIAAIAALAVVSTLIPARGIQDRIAGTYPVPR